MCYNETLETTFEPLGYPMELLVLLVADYASVDEKRKLNVMGIFNNIYALKFPARHPEMYVIVKLAAYPGEYGEKREITVKLLDEDANEELVNWSREIVIQEAPPGQNAEINNILTVRDVIFKKPGTYEFLVLVDKDLKGSLPLYLNLQEPEKEAGE